MYVERAALETSEVLEKQQMEERRAFKQSL